MIHVKDLPNPEDLYPIKRALLSVFDKTGLVEFAQVLSSFGVELISTGGTKRKLQEAGLEVKDVSELTGFPEMLDGRVKTLHPLVHAGLLARKTDSEDMKQLTDQGTSPIDLVVVNLYPFEEAISNGEVNDAIAIENIDIGGPTMLRSAAKNFFFTAVVSSSNDYKWIAEELASNSGALSLSTRRMLAGKVFELTGQYNQAISKYFGVTIEASSNNYQIDLPRYQELRYGENPHQTATFYGKPDEIFEKLHGKDLSFNNMLDLSAALSILDEFSSADPTIAILKHTNPCGVAQASSLLEAYNKAFATDRQSPFGGIVIANRAMDMETAQAINEVFTEIIIAPDFEDEVLEFLMKKKNRRLVKSKSKGRVGIVDVRTVAGGLLVQEKDPSLASSEEFRDSLTVVTNRHPTPSELDDLEFTWRVSKHVKSNAIVYGKNRATLGIGAGQMSRIDASEIAVAKGKKSALDFDKCVVASDAFFPFSDGLLAAADAGAIAAIQPGGSVRDDQVIEAANERGMAMVFTGRRHFRH